MALSTQTKLQLDIYEEIWFEFKEQKLCTTEYSQSDCFVT